MRLRDELGVLYDDQDCAALFATCGQPAESPGRLLLILVLQFLDSLTDRQAADAVRGRMDWKYTLGLELTDPGFDYSVLSEFRMRIVAADAVDQSLNHLLTRCQERGLLKTRGQQRTDSTNILVAIRTINRLECVGEAMYHALHSLLQVDPAWVQVTLLTDWLVRYGTLRWRTEADWPPTVQLIVSRYDPDVRFGIKRDIRWTGPPGRQSRIWRPGHDTYGQAIMHVWFD